MDVNYTDTNRIDQGVLQGFKVDFDTGTEMDFVITVGIGNHIMTGGCWWYIEETEYGGIVDRISVITENNEIQYSGRNFRGVLNTKIICPPVGEDYKIVSGNITDVTESLLREAALQDLFTVEKCNVDVASFRFKRYVELYEGLVDLAYQHNKVIALKSRTGKTGNECRLEKVVVSFMDPIDYSGDSEYNETDIHFRITKGYNTVNHLICLGKGELKDRLVAHLYVDGDSDIVEKQYYFGLDEVAATYELNSEEDTDALKKAGVAHLSELQNVDSLEVDAPDITLKIGDVVGGYEKVTGFTVKREIVNIVAMINDDGMTFQYTVGGDAPRYASLPSEIVDEYILPVASDTILGGIKVGESLNMNDGTLESNALSSFRKELEEAIKICS